MENYSGVFFILDVVIKLFLCDLTYRFFKVMFWEE